MTRGGHERYRTSDLCRVKAYGPPGLTCGYAVKRPLTCANVLRVLTPTYGGLRVSCVPCVSQEARARAPPLPSTTTTTRRGRTPMGSTTTTTAADQLRALLALPDERPGAWESEHIIALEGDNDR